MAKKAKPEKPAKVEKPAKAAKPVREKAPTVVRPKPVREPVYTVMAAITLVAALVGCGLLYKDFDEYGQQAPPKADVTLPALGSEKGGAAPAPG